MPALEADTPHPRALIPGLNPGIQSFRRTNTHASARPEPSLGARVKPGHEGKEECPR